MNRPQRAARIDAAPAVTPALRLVVQEAPRTDERPAAAPADRPDDLLARVVDRYGWAM